MQIQLPLKKGQTGSQMLDFEQLVVIGANGSGKTRFGSRIEEFYLGQAHRISAQKSLTFPTHVSPTTKERAEIAFKYGNYFEHFTSESQYHGNKIGNRWGGNLNTSLLNDFDKLLVLLHTEEYEDSLSFKEGRIAKPTTKLDRVQKIWEQVLPHRKLFKTAGTIQTYPTGHEASKYNASEMSDGERVIFYLIGEVVCARANAIIIIDEPESHLHKSLIKNLFDLIEKERQDCCFIYLTHDIDFAFTRQNALKIWAKTYEGSNVWDYEILDDTSPIPEQLYMEVLGSRNPVIFLEGENSSIDYELYEQVYSDFTLKPLGSCDKVIHCVKSFNEHNTFHHIYSFGIIDRDRRPESEILKLTEKNIWVLDVAEAENLLLTENVIKVVAKYLGKDPKSTFEQVSVNLFSFFALQLDSQILLHFSDSLRKKYQQLASFTERDISGVISEIDKGYSGIDKRRMFNDFKAHFESVIAKSDYNELLRIFNLKNALIPQSKICELLGLKNREAYLGLILTLLKRGDAISQDIKKEIDGRVIK
jgi:hypothetical protein